METLATDWKRHIDVTIREDVALLSGNVPIIGKDNDTNALCEPFWSHESCYRFGDEVFIHTSRLQDILNELRENDYQIEGFEYTEWPQLDRAVQPEQLPGLATYEKDMLRSVRDNAWGQILIPPELAPGMTAALTRFFAEENILVIGKNQEAVERIENTLKQRSERRVSTGSEIRWNDRPFVRIESNAGLCRSSHDWSVLIFADLESARSDTGMQQAMSMPEAAIYAFIPPNRNIDWEDNLRLRITSGPVIHRMDATRSTDAAVTVLAVSARRARKKLLFDSLKDKRKQIWSNAKRNQQVVGIAEAFVSGNQARLRDYGIPINRIEQQLGEIGQHPSVAIVVESPEHGWALRKLLPDWQLAKGSRLANKHWPTFPLDEAKVIVTRTRAKAAGLAADVMILADGVGNAWNDACGPHMYFNSRQMLVIDLQDKFNELVWRCGRYRLQDYEEREWPVIEQDPAQIADKADLAYCAP